MAAVRAVAKFVRLSPRKASLVAREVNGKRVDEALAYLKFLPKGAAKPISKVIKSAASNAENNHRMDPARLIVKSVTADQGP
jgi:large subunit ribosomal protein L22